MGAFKNKNNVKLLNGLTATKIMKNISILIEISKKASNMYQRAKCLVTETAINWKDAMRKSASIYREKRDTKKMALEAIKNGVVTFWKAKWNSEGEVETTTRNVIPFDAFHYDRKTDNGSTDTLKMWDKDKLNAGIDKVKCIISFNTYQFMY